MCIFSNSDVVVCWGSKFLNFVMFCPNEHIIIRKSTYIALKCNKPVINDFFSKQNRKNLIKHASLPSSWNVYDSTVFKFSASKASSFTGLQTLELCYHCLSRFCQSGRKVEYCAPLEFRKSGVRILVEQTKTGR